MAKKIKQLSTTPRNFGSVLSNHKSQIKGPFSSAVMPGKIVKKELDKRASQFKTDKSGALLCVYCDDKASTWDHLYAIRKKNEWSGYYNEVENLVPCCGHCNHSKGNEDWLVFSQTKNLEKCEALKKIVDQSKPKKISKRKFEEVKKSKIYQEYESIQKKIMDLLDTAQRKATAIKELIEYR